ncbi:hypothetical protein, partial [Aquidulcibacter sp.]|uniref:hypothetical protein n=1 Tax=Aquidulcibacter sp. TaxID=2052990 RepID=UPI0025BBEAAC
RPGYVPAPVLDIPAGALQASSSDRFDPWARPDAVVNTVIGAYPDPSQGWQITPLPPATDSAWVASDGGVRAASEDLSFVPYRDQAWRIATRKARGFRLMGSRDFTGPHWLIELEPGDVVTAPDPALPYLATKWWMVQRCVLLAKEDGLTCQITLNEIDSAIDAAPSAIGSPASFTPSSLARALAVPSVTIGQRVVSGGSGGQYPELTFLIPDTASQGSGVVQLQGPATGNTTPLLAAAQIRNIGLSRGLLHGEPVVPGWYRWRAAGRDVDGSVGAFDTTWQAAVQVTAPLVAGEAGAGIGGAPILNSQVPLGENQVVNSDLNQGLNGFEFAGAGATNLTGTGINTSSGRNLVASPNYFGARNVFWSLATVSSGNFTGGTYLESFRQLGISGPTPTNLRRYATQVTPGERLYFSAKVAVHGMTNASVALNYYDRDGVYLSTTQASAVVGDARVGGPSGFLGIPSNFATIGGFATVPANAVFAALSVYGSDLNGPQSSAYVFACDYFVAKVGADQTIAPAYNAGPVDRAADRTADAVPILEGPASVSFDVDGAGALSPGSQVPRTLQFIRKLGSTDVSTSTTWSIVSPVNVTLGTITNGGVNITAIAPGNSSFTVRSTRAGEPPIDHLVTVQKNTIAAAGVGGAKINRDDTPTGIASGTYNAVLSATINSGPAGLARIELSYLPLTWSGASSNFQFRLTRAGVQLAETGIFNGIDGAGDIGDFLTEIQTLAGFYSVAAGTAVWALEAKRTSGSGTINTAAGELVVSQTET